MSVMSSFNIHFYLYLLAKTTAALKSEMLFELKWLVEDAYANYNAV